MCVCISVCVCIFSRMYIYGDTKWCQYLSHIGICTMSPI